MQNPTESFVMHDLAQFPLVWVRQGIAAPGSAAQWEREMAGLLSLAAPFVMLHGAMLEQETHEDRRRRGLWLKQHKQALQRYCCAMIGIEPDPLKRLAMKEQSALATKAFGIPTEVAASREVAERLARQWIGKERAGCAGDTHAD